VAGSTHRGEETHLVQSLQALRLKWPALGMIIAPRHVERVGEVEALLSRSGLKAVRWSQAQPGKTWDVMVVDVFGQLPIAYALGQVAFIGGSLIAHGGQNPLEAASLGKPTVFGPFMHNFRDIVDALMRSDACRQVDDAASLTPALSELLADALFAQRIGAQARALVERSQGATQRTLQALRSLLPDLKAE